MGMSAGGFMAVQGAAAAVSSVGAWSAANGQKIALGSQASAADSQATIATIQGQMAINNGEATARTAELNAKTSAAFAQITAGSTSATALMNAQSVAQTAELNARLAEDSAQFALLNGQRQEQKLDLAAAQLKSKQRATMAANGVDLGSGSPLNVLTSTDVMHASDANQISSNAIRAAFGYRMQETNYQNQATMARATGEAQSTMALAGGSISSLMSNTAGGIAARTARTQGSVSNLSAQASAVGLRANASGLRFGADSISPVMAAGTSLLSSASKVATSYYMADKQGMFDKPASVDVSKVDLTYAYGMDSGYVMPPPQRISNMGMSN